MKLFTVCMLTLALGTSARAQFVEDLLRPADIDSNDWFGFSLASDQGCFVAGAPKEGLYGAAYVYRSVGPDWLEVAKLTPPPPATIDADFGADVAISGDTVVVGAPRMRGPTQILSGAAYVFRRNGGAWSLEAELFPSTPSGFMVFGISVAIDGERLVVGARLEDPGGVLYVFERAGNVWTETARLESPGIAEDDYLGIDVDIDGDTIAAGAFGVDGPLGSDLNGAVHLFREVSGTWTHEAVLPGPSGYVDANFGFSVDLEGERVLVGAPSQCCTEYVEGAAYLYERVAGAWGLQVVLQPPGALLREHFGYTVALCGEQILVGAPGEDSVALCSGAAYLFRDTGVSWDPIGRLVGIDPDQGERFGRAVAFDGERPLVSAPFYDPPQQGGAVYSLESSPDLGTYCRCESGAPCGNFYSFGGCLNSTGAGANLLSHGSTSVLADDLELLLIDTPPGEFGLLFLGLEANGAVQLFGDGHMCIAPGAGGYFQRFPAQASSAYGVISEGPGLAAWSLSNPSPAHHFVAGATLHFQGWYRDPASPCGANFNSSNALRVTFRP